MKKRFLKTLSVITAAIMMVFAFQTGAIAADTGAFASSESNGITFSEVNGNPFYTIFGSGAVYASADGESWLQRYNNADTPLKDVNSIAFGNDRGIGIKLKELTAKYFDRDMNYAGEIHNYVPGATGADGYFIYLIPEIYYDSYSGLFFCHGYNETANALNIYYTDGILTTADNGGTEVSALSWTKVSGDFLSSVTRSHTDGIDGIPHWLIITGDGKGNILAPYGQNYWGTNFAADEFTGNSTNSDIRRYCTVIKTTTEGAVTGAYCYTTQVLSSVGAITDNGIAVLRCHGATNNEHHQKIYVADLNTAVLSTGSVKAVNMGDVMTDFVKGQVVENMFVNGNDVYIATGACNTLYKLTVNYDAETKAITLGAPTNILANTSFGDADTTGWKLKDMYFLGNNKALVLYNNAAYTSATASYLYELDLKDYTVTKIDSDDTYVNIDVGSTSLTITPNTYAPHGLTLQIGSTAPTTDKMIYEYSDPDGAKYLLDLDGIDVNGIFAWDDAVSGECRFTLTARSADYPSVMKTAQITAIVGE